MTDPKRPDWHRIFKAAHQAGESLIVIVCGVCILALAWIGVCFGWWLIH